MLSSGSFAHAVVILGSLYFLLWAIAHLTMGVIAAIEMRNYKRRQSRRGQAVVDRITLPLISIVVPAYNEELTIVESIRALLGLDYEPCEIVVVNDGSTDGTLRVLQDVFYLLAAPLAYVQPLASARVRGIYRSAVEPRLVIVDKENGGCKADAANAGINAASGKLVMVMDADTVLAPEALSRAVLPFLEDARTIAVGANVAIVNGCRIEDGRLAEIALPRHWLPRLQVVEYMRAFLLYRLTCARWNGLLILSGAFGLFRRDAVVAVGGYDRTAIGEDMDLTVRLHRYFRERRQPFRIAFNPAPLCATQAPEDWLSLRSQRLRWRRGLMQVFWRHRGMIGNPRYGAAGLVTFPYTFVFEGMAPLLEFASYILTTIAFAAGLLEWQTFRTVILIWTLLGTSVTMLAILLHDVATRRYLGTGDLATLVLVGLMENYGYRQLSTWWGTVGTVQALRGTGGWGTMKRRQFERANV
jgi:cellulose synthase/poly-beta-1,6-N-acetylglucosamine synthase-like glycosyltransferase